MMLRSASRPLEPVPWQRELLHLSAMFIEVPWCILLFIALAPGAGQMSPINVGIYVVANMLISLELVRIMALRNVPYEISRWIVLAGIVAAMALGIFVVFPTPERPLALSSMSKTAPLIVPSVLLTGVLVFFLWYRGIRLATQPVTPGRASFSFRLGLLILVALALIPNARFQSELVAMLPLFFLAGLSSTTLARMANLRINREIQRTSFGKRWLGFTGLVAVVISAIGFVIALLLAGFGLEGAGQIIGGILAGIGAVLVTIMLPVLYVVEKILEGTAGAINSIFNQPKTVILQNSVSVVNDNTGKGTQPDLSQIAALLDNLKYVVVVAVIAVIVFGIFMLLRNRAMSQIVEGEERESLDDADLRDSLGGLLRNGLAGLQNLLKTLGQFGVGRDLVNVLTIKRLYARLIAQAAEQGYSRGPAETPFEYQSALNKAFPGYSAEIELVTRAYVNVHYGELPDNPDALTAVKAAVDRVLDSIQERR